MGKDIRIRFAKRLRVLRKKRGWTQEELAEKSDLAWRQVQRLESTAKITAKSPAARLDTLEKIAKAFKITPSALIDFKK